VQRGQRWITFDGFINKEITMDTLDALIDQYIAIWNDTDDTRRRALIASTWTEDANYLDPYTHAYGHAALDAMVRDVQQRYPAHRFSRSGAIDSYQDRVRFCWEMAPVAPVTAGMQGTMHVKGVDFGVVKAGRLQSVTGFIVPLEADPAPAKPRSADGWSVARFAAFWARPDVAMVPRALAPDVAGYWPGEAVPVCGVAQYTARIAHLLAMVPDFRLDVAEHAQNGDCIFIRWIAHGTWHGEPLAFTGVDRIRVRDGLVAENRIFCDHPLVYALARSARAMPAAVPA
jgi:ketosteroid isomerase-like protein